ncbi:MAG: preprotein translocase subunit SecG [Planctomycetota bacterium]|nr:preprotein translocase subunit SecG [Planctomycetota bacterium]
MLARSTRWEAPVPLDTLALPVAALSDVLTTLVMVLFLLSAFLLTVVVLLQEGKGGGLSGAFGGAGAEAFGVKAGTVNKFTAWLGAAFLGLALLHAGLVSAYSTFSVEGDTRPAVGDILPGDEDAGDANTENTEGNGDEQPAPGGGNGDEQPAPGGGNGDSDEGDGNGNPAPGDDSDG